jgi:hypothetical protein
MYVCIIGTNVVYIVFSITCMFRLPQGVFVICIHCVRDHTCSIPEHVADYLVMSCLLSAFLDDKSLRPGRHSACSELYPHSWYFDQHPVNIP